MNADTVDTDQRAGFGPATAKFIQQVKHRGLLPDDDLDRPAPDPAEFGFPTGDGGSRDDLLLSGHRAMAPFEPDVEALRVSSVRVVRAIGALGEVPDNDPAAFAARLRKCSTRADRNSAKAASHDITDIRP